MSVTITQSSNHTFRDNWEFQEGYYPQVERILKDNALHFINISVADKYKDMTQATDFVVKIDGGDVAVRIRRADCKYRDLTIRSYNKGRKTEIDKLRDGFGKYYLYCWENEKKELSEWMLIDLDKVRESGLLDSKKTKMNKGYNTGFIAIDWLELQIIDCVIARSSKGNA